MSKPYFAKYLPVEGEKQLATFLSYKGEVYNHLPGLCKKDPKEYTFIQIEGASRGYHERWEDLTAVELFLCSRDIQVGDRIQNIHVPLTGELAIASAKDPNHCLEHDFIANYEEPTFSDNSKENKFSSYSSNKDWFKVIGEIPSGVLWIKEGDASDEKEFRLIYECEMGSECGYLFGADYCPAPHSIMRLQFICPTCKISH